MWKIEERKKEMTAPITLRSLDEAKPDRPAAVATMKPPTPKRARATRCSCSQRKDRPRAQIAQTVLRSQDTVVRVLKRFITGGVEAVPRRTAPGRARTVTTAWDAELLPRDRVGSP